MNHAHGHDINIESVEKISLPKKFHHWFMYHYPFACMLIQGLETDI